MNQKGDRVELIRCTDKYTKLEPGERGTVAFVDSTGTVHVSWDSGAVLGLVRAAGDSWRTIEPSEKEES